MNALAGGVSHRPLSTTLRVQAQFPSKFRPLLEQRARYKVYYGGRGGAKSWQFARALLIKGLSGGLRVLCTREVQSSLKESVKQLLVDQIALLGLGAYYRVLEAEIRGPDGTLFMFKGLSDPEALKSAEGIDIVWIEEARTVTKNSWTKLDFTVRKPGAEIWVSFNPELDTDYLYQLFVEGEPPPSSVVVKVGYLDNPWISDDFVRKANHLKATDPDEWDWAIGGNCRVAIDGAIYTNELRALTRDDPPRVCRVPVERTKAVHTFWDLGRGDNTAIWFAQIVGMQYRIPLYYQNNGFHIDHYLAHLVKEREDRGWFYGTMWLPHDADHKLLGAKRTIRQQVEDAGFRVRIAPKLPVHEGISAARAIFPQCWFDEAGTKEGRACLAAYKYDVDDDGTRSKLPLHNWASHGADGFRTMGVALKDDAAPKAKMKPKLPRPAQGRHSWLAR